MFLNFISQIRHIILIFIILLGIKIVNERWQDVDSKPKTIFKALN